MCPDLPAASDGLLLNMHIQQCCQGHYARLLPRLGARHVFARRFWFDHITRIFTRRCSSPVASTVRAVASIVGCQITPRGVQAAPSYRSRRRRVAITILNKAITACTHAPPLPFFAPFLRHNNGSAGTAFYDAVHNSLDSMKVRSSSFALAAMTMGVCSGAPKNFNGD